MARVDCIQVETVEKNVQFLAFDGRCSEEEGEFAELFQKQQDFVAKIPAILEANVAKDSRSAESVPPREARECQENGELVVFRFG